MDAHSDSKKASVGRKWRRKREKERDRRRERETDRERGGREAEVKKG